jgi:SAM-dependent methyltransferase
MDNGESKKLDIILDFGCAMERLTNLLRDDATNKVISFEISSSMIDRVCETANKKNWDNVEAVAGCLVDWKIPPFKSSEKHTRRRLI